MQDIHGAAERACRGAAQTSREAMRASKAPMAASLGLRWDASTAPAAPWGADPGPPRGALGLGACWTTFDSPRTSRSNRLAAWRSQS